MRLLLLLAFSLSSYAQWITGYYNDQNGVQTTAQVPWSKYTHLIMFAAAPGTTAGAGDGTVILNSLLQTDINAMVAGRPIGKKLLVCIQDNGSFTSAFSQSAAPALLSTFVANIAAFVTSNGFDGVDIDWEDNVNTTYYKALLVALRMALPHPYLITMTDYGQSTAAANAEQANVDQINVQCYDMNTEPGGEDCAGTDCSFFNSAIVSAGDAWKRTCQQRIALYTAAGVASPKIGVGIPFYETQLAGVDAPLVNGDFTRTTFSYQTMVTNAAIWQPQYMNYNTTYEAEYLSIPPGTNEFISYVSPKGIGAYVAWMKSQGFGGFMTFTTAYEFNGAASGDDRWPLSSALWLDLFGGSSRGGNGEWGGHRTSQ